VVKRSLPHTVHFNETSLRIEEYQFLKKTSSDLFYKDLASIQISHEYVFFHSKNENKYKLLLAFANYAERSKLKNQLEKLAQHYSIELQIG
jgi:hypothetical protein